jgi:hypothetical protein
MKGDKYGGFKKMKLVTGKSVRGESSDFKLLNRSYHLEDWAYGSKPKVVGIYQGTSIR